MLMCMKRNALVRNVLFRDVDVQFWRALSTAVPSESEVKLQHLEGDLEGIAVIGLQRAAAKNSFR